LRRLANTRPRLLPNGKLRERQNKSAGQQDSSETVVAYHRDRPLVFEKVWNSSKSDETGADALRVPQTGGRHSRRNENCGTKTKHLSA
jgi:hypothetical protein